MRSFNFFRIMIVIAVLLLFWMNEQGVFKADPTIEEVEAQPIFKDSSITQVKRQP